MDTDMNDIFYTIESGWTPKKHITKDGLTALCGSDVGEPKTVRKGNQIKYENNELKEQWISLGESKWVKMSAVDDDRCKNCLKILKQNTNEMVEKPKVDKRREHHEVELKRFEETGYRESRAYPEYYMPMYEFLKEKHPDTILLECAHNQFMFRPDKAEKVLDILAFRKNEASNKWGEARKNFDAIYDMVNELKEKV